MTATAPVTYSPPAGAYGTPQTVTLSTETAGADIYYTLDGSEPGIEDFAITQLTAAGQRNWYACTAIGNVVLAGPEYGNLQRSADGGATWAPIPALGDQYWRDGAVSPSGSVVMSNHGGYLYRSADAGLTWAAVGPALWLWHANACSQVTGTRIAPVQNGLLYRSTDDGLTWDPLAAPTARDWYGVYCVDGVFIASASGSQYLYQSTDDGLTWAAITSTGLRDWTTLAGRHGIWIASVRNGKPLRSTDGGATWVELSALPVATMWSWALANARVWFLGILNGALYQSIDDGATWTVASWAGTKAWYPGESLGDGSVIFGGAGNDYLSKITGGLSGELYTAPLTISETTTIKAIAVKAGLDDSAVTSAEYSIIAGKFYIPSFKVRLHDDERFLTDTKEFEIGSQPIDIPDDETLRYVCAVRNGNSVSIQLKPHTDVYSINFSNTVPLWRVARFGDAIHQINYNNAGDGLANKHEFMLLRTEPYRLAYDSAFSVVMDGRNISISAANVFFGHRRIEVLQFHSTTDIVTNWYHAASEWEYAPAPGGMWPNDSYDNGADVVAMSNNQWGAVFLYRSIGDDKEIFYVRGSSEESNKEKARLIPIPQEPDLVQWHSVLVGRIIFQEGASTGEFEPYSKATFVRSQTPSIALNDLTDVTVDGSEAGAFLQKNLAGEWVGNQLVWDDMRHLSNIKIIGTDRPEYVAFGVAFLALEFTVGDMVWCDSEQIPHGWNGGPIRPHIHICTDAAGGTGNMVWEVIIASRPAGNGAWSSGQTIQKTWTGTLGAYGVTILDLWDNPGVTLANTGSSTIMKIRLRLVSATFTGRMYLDGFDSHIQIKRAGTISEFGAL